jgi:hypothetical protein
MHGESPALRPQDIANQAAIFGCPSRWLGRWGLSRLIQCVSVDG